MALNYAEVWSPELLEIYRQQSLVSPFMVSNVNWLSAKTFHKTRATTTGYKSHARTGGWNAGTYSQNDNEFTLTHDRDVEFLIDIADVDETNATASIQNIARVFTATKKVPESNALFFSKVATAAIGANLYTETATTAYTAANTYTKLKTILAKSKLRRYRAQGALIMYVSSTIMDLLEKSTELQRKIEQTQVADGGLGIETRITYIDGVPIFEVIDDDVFYNKFNFDPTNGGYAPIEHAAAVEGSKKINVLVASPLSTMFVPKINTIYYFNPGTHTRGDGYLYQDRSLSDVFVMPNGDTNAIDSIFVDIDTAEYGLDTNVLNYPAPIYNYPVGSDTYPVPTGDYVFAISTSAVTGVDYEINVSGEIPLISTATKTGLGLNSVVTHIFGTLIKIPFTGTFDLAKVKYASGVGATPQAVEATDIYTIGTDKYLINVFGVYDVGSGVIANYKADADDRNIINVEYDEEVLTYKYTYVGATLEA